MMDDSMNRNTELEPSAKENINEKSGEAFANSDENRENYIRYFINRFSTFDPYRSIALTLNYFTKMLDRVRQGLPYGLVFFDEFPVRATHGRTDGSVVSAMWYDGICDAEKLFKHRQLDYAKRSYYNHMMNFVREHTQNPDAPTLFKGEDFVCVHELSYLLSGLNTVIRTEPQNIFGEKYSRNLVDAVLRCAEKIEDKGKKSLFGYAYALPTDDSTKDLGMCEEYDPVANDRHLMNASLVLPLAERYILTGDETALDLAKGIADHCLSFSGSITPRLLFVGNSFYVLRFARGLIKLGVALGDRSIIEKGKTIYDNMRKNSMSFGWFSYRFEKYGVRGLACETRCVAEAVLCAFDLIEAGYPKYYTDADLISRNHLYESQIRYAKHYNCWPDLENTDNDTFRRINKRALGSYAEYTYPARWPQNSNGNPSAMASALALKAMIKIYENAVTVRKNGLVVCNFPIEAKHEYADITTRVPNTGIITAYIKKDCRFAFRQYKGMGRRGRVTVNDEIVPATLENGLICCGEVKAGDIVTFYFSCVPIIKKETVKVAQREYEFTYLNVFHDVLGIRPATEHFLLYQRDLHDKLYLPNRRDTLMLKKARKKPLKRKL